MVNAVLIVLCGGLGCISRYLVSGWVNGWFGPGFPYGTLAANILGAFIIGFLMEFGLRSTLIPASLRVGLTVGFLGGLTTFSTFSYETIGLIQRGHLLYAGVNALGSVVVCVIFAWVGIRTARSL